ncbi:putative uncharacterized protein ENSP00000383309 [Procambarus clarkii]|uniref:putative uncharacterized protein ENSP00000383309 n=1 Tax=Procambarus clarkii TaxID=6728 RepID=UPI003743303C
MADCDARESCLSLRHLDTLSHLHCWSRVKRTQPLPTLLTQSPQRRPSGHIVTSETTLGEPPVQVTSETTLGEPPATKSSQRRPLASLRPQSHLRDDPWRASGSSHLRDDPWRASGHKVTSETTLGEPPPTKSPQRRPLASLRPQSHLRDDPWRASAHKVTSETTLGEPPPTKSPQRRPLASLRPEPEGRRREQSLSFPEPEAPALAGGNRASAPPPGGQCMTYPHSMVYQCSAQVTLLLTG